MERRDDCGRVQFFAILEGNPDRAAVACNDFRYSRFGANLTAESTSGLLHGVRHRAHSSFREGPSAEVTVADASDRMMEHDIGCSWLIGTGPRTDHGVASKSRFHLIRFEPVVEEVGG